MVLLVFCTGQNLKRTHSDASSFIWQPFMTDLTGDVRYQYCHSAHLLTVLNHHASPVSKSISILISISEEVHECLNIQVFNSLAS